MVLILINPPVLKRICRKCADISDLPQAALERLSDDCNLISDSVADFQGEDKNVKSFLLKKLVYFWVVLENGSKYLIRHPLPINDPFSRVSQEFAGPSFFRPK